MKTSFFGWAMGIVAVSALVACGDDGGTGGGGQGGDGSGGATTATTTTTTTGDTTTTTTTGGEGGNEGEGGEGGGTGGNSACTAVTLTEVEGGSGSQGQGIIAGTIDPNIGAELIDQAFVEFWDDGETFNGTEPGTYELADEVDYATCSRCVLAIQDVPEGEGDAAKVFFASSGTLELAEEGNVIGAGFGVVTLNDVTLVEVEFTEEGMNVVDGGDCLFIESLEYDNPKIVPDTWTCDPAYYEDGGGFCDCACGAFDPDCESPDSFVFGCDDEAAAYCDAAGECAASPSWWECDAAEFDDGTTCNCECAGPDPDCDSALDLPVDGCDAGQTCSADGLTCLDPEAICTDALDNDNDGTIDCGDADACQGTAACASGLTPQDGACDANSDCLAIPDPLCVTHDEWNVVTSFCSQWCDVEADDCGLGATCFDVGVEGGVCFTDCAEDDDCADGFGCRELAEGALGCFPIPPAGWECSEGFYNANDGCDCGCGIVDPDCEDATAASCEFCAEPSCANDGTQFGCDAAAIDADNNATCN